MNAAKQKNLTSWGIILLIIILVGLAVTKRYKHKIADAFSPKPTPTQPVVVQPTPPTQPVAPGQPAPVPLPPITPPSNPSNPVTPTPSPSPTPAPNPTPAPGLVTPVPQTTLDSVVRRIDAAPDSKYPPFKKAILKGVLKSARRVDLIATIGFDSGSSSLGAQGKSLVDQLVTAPRLPSDFLNREDLRILTVGYASPPGNPGTNLALAEKRSESVRQYLVNGKQLPETRLNDISVGETELLNSSDASKNQAVEIWLVEIDPALLKGL